MNQRREYIDLLKDISKIVSVSSFAIFLFWMMGRMAKNAGQEVMQESYRAWVKHTGNPKELTFEEFLALRRSGLHESSHYPMPRTK